MGRTYYAVLLIASNIQKNGKGNVRALQRGKIQNGEYERRGNNASKLAKIKQGNCKFIHYYIKNP